MDSLFAKTIFLFSFLLASITGPSYIKIVQDNLIFNFKTGEIFPIYYYLNTQNIGPQKARFEISSDVQWISVYREGSSFAFVELPSQAYINFILEIHPGRLPDGVNKAKVFIKVLDINLLVSQELVLDETEVSIILNKNIISTTPTQTPIQTLISIPTLTPEPTVILTPTPLEAARVRSAPLPLTGPTPRLIPAKTVSPTLSPISSPSLESNLKQIQSIIDSIWLFLKKIF